MPKSDRCVSRPAVRVHVLHAALFSNRAISRGCRASGLYQLHGASAGAATPTFFQKSRRCGPISLRRFVLVPRSLVSGYFANRRALSLGCGEQTWPFERAAGRRAVGPRKTVSGRTGAAPVLDVLECSAAPKAESSWRSVSWPSSVFGAFFRKNVPWFSGQSSEPAVVPSEGSV